MLLLIVFSVLVIVQFGGVANGLQRDSGYNHYTVWLSKQSALRALPEVWLLLCVLLPTLLMAALEAFLFRTSLLLYFLFSVMILLFCLGRGEFGTALSRYLEASKTSDWAKAVQAVQDVDVSQRPPQVVADDWAQLHVQLIRRASYRGFERLFVVFFWYMLLGLAGALLYRLAVLVRTNSYKEGHKPGCDMDLLAAQEQVANKFIWLLEWPAARVLGLSFALTGNFVSCFNHWRDCLWCFERSTEEVMYSSAIGALAIAPDEAGNPAVGEQEVTLLQQLISRTLVFWLCVLSVLYLFF